MPDEMAPARKKTKGPGKEEKGQMAARGGYPHAMSKDGKASQGGRLPKPPPGARFEKPLGMSQCVPRPRAPHLWLRMLLCCRGLEPRTSGFGCCCLAACAAATLTERSGGILIRGTCALRFLEIP